MMTNEQLQSWVQAVSEREFQLPFRHKATFNHRLRSTGGRYFTHTHNIEISSHQYTEHGFEETEKIIKHELCHYHLHLQRRGFRHRDPEFKQLLAKVGGSRYCKALPDKLRRGVMPYKYELRCLSCGMIYLRKRKVNIRKYACGRCRGKLVMKSLDIPAE